MSAPAVFKRARRASLTGRPPTVPPISSSDESEWSAEDAPSLPPSLITATHSEDPVDPLRRMNTVLEFAGAGALCIGCAFTFFGLDGNSRLSSTSTAALVVSLYVTGPPRLNDYASSSTAVLLVTLVCGCAACVPSWRVCSSRLVPAADPLDFCRAAALLILLGRKPAKDDPPPHPKLLRSAALASLVRQRVPFHPS